jgi:hypothetical protein
LSNDLYLQKHLDENGAASMATLLFFPTIKKKLEHVAPQHKIIALREACAMSESLEVMDYDAVRQKRHN